MKDLIKNKPKMGNETILLIDDEDLILDIGVKILSKFGYSTLIANSGEIGIETYKKRQKDIALIILDLNMPGMDGMRCLKELLTLDNRAKIIVASGYVDKKMIDETKRAGACGFISKPYHILSMLETVRHQLDGGQDF